MSSNFDHWKPVFSAGSEHETDIVKALLADNNILSETIGGADHVFDTLNTHSTITLYVHEDDFDAATRLIQNTGG